MGRISKIAELHARKQALVTQSEVCREDLLAELDKLKSYTDGFAQKVGRVRQIAPWFMLAAPAVLPVIGLLVGKRFKPRQAFRPEPRRGKIAKVMMALRLLSKYGPLLRSFASRLKTRQNSSPKQRDWTVHR